MGEPVKTEPFFPDWADEKLGKPSATVFDRAELEMLREFYKRWEALHGITNDKLHRKQKEQAAQNLVEAAHAVRRLYAH